MIQIKKASTIFLSIVFTCIMILFTGCSEINRYTCVSEYIGCDDETYKNFDMIYTSIEFDFKNKTYSFKYKKRYDDKEIIKNGIFTEEGLDVNTDNYLIALNERCFFSEDYNNFYISINLEEYEKEYYDNYFIVFRYEIENKK